MLQGWLSLPGKVQGEIEHYTLTLTLSLPGTKTTQAMSQDTQNNDHTGILASFCIRYNFKVKGTSRNNVQRFYNLRYLSRTAAIKQNHSPNVIVFQSSTKRTRQLQPCCLGTHLLIISPRLTDVRSETMSMTSWQSQGRVELQSVRSTHLESMWISDKQSASQSAGVNECEYRQACFLKPDNICATTTRQYNDSCNFSEKNTTKEKWKWGCEEFIYVPS